ncbi:hypothetical protein AAKU55_001592 [Oxalobacteraceae bacterium GrIS 1.11]
MKTTLPENLVSALDGAKNLITQEGELPAHVRKMLLELIEDLSVVEHSKAGYLRRARLALICAQKTLIHISQYNEVFRSAQDILLKGHFAISGKYDLTSLEKENGNFHTDVIDLQEHGDVAFIPVYAGMACFSAINTILYDTNFEVIGTYEKETSPDDWDAGYYASLAASGSAVWENKNGNMERLIYWRWYLETAIPQAWEVELVLDLPSNGDK